jgi:hypothetical protein
MWDEHNEEREKRKMEPMKLNFSLGHRIEIKM